MTLLDEREPGVSLKLIVGLLSVATVVLFSGMFFLGNGHQSGTAEAPLPVQTGNM